MNSHTLEYRLNEFSFLAEMEQGRFAYFLEMSLEFGQRLGNLFKYGSLRNNEELRQHVLTQAVEMQNPNDAAEFLVKGLQDGTISPADVEALRPVLAEKRLSMGSSFAQVGTDAQYVDGGTAQSAGGNIANAGKNLKKPPTKGNVYDLLHSQYKSKTGGKYDNNTASATLSALAKKNGMSNNEFKEAYARGDSLILDVSPQEIKVNTRPTSRTSQKRNAKTANPYSTGLKNYGNSLVTIAKWLFGGDEPIYTEHKGDLSKKHNPDVRYNIPDEAPGLSRYGNNNEDHWATKGTADWVDATSKEWAKNNAKSPISINDFSVLGGGPFSPHNTHREGVDFDVKWQTTDGKPRSGSFANSSVYDRKKTIKMINTFINNVPSGYKLDKVFFADRKVWKHFKNKGYASQIRYDIKHPTHLHFRLRRN